MRTVTAPHFALLADVVMLLLASLVTGTAADYGEYHLHRDVRIKDAPQDLKRASFEFWLPDDHSQMTICGVISIVKYQTGSVLWEYSPSKDKRNVYEGLPEALKQFATEKRLGILLELVENRDSRRKLYKGPYQITAVRHALRYFAEKSGHEEVENAPIIWTGLSQAGGTAFRKSARVPEQTMGAIAWHAANWDRDLAGGLDVPLLVAISAEDPLVDSSMAFPPEHASSGALWTPLLQADTPHHHLENSHTQFGIYFEWLRWLLEVRVAHDSVDSKLKPIDKTQGFYIVGAISPNRPYRWQSIDLFPAGKKVPEGCMGWIPNRLLESWITFNKPSCLGPITVHESNAE